MIVLRAASGAPDQPGYAELRVAMFCDRGEHEKCEREGGAMVYGPRGKVRCGCECHQGAS